MLKYGIFTVKYGIFTEKYGIFTWGKSRKALSVLGLSRFEKMNKPFKPFKAKKRAHKSRPLSAKRDFVTGQVTQQNGETFRDHYTTAGTLC